MQSEGVPVDLYIYDLTNGLASVISPSIVGHKVEGVWHTSIVVYEREYFFGGQGISSCPPGSTSLRAPHQVTTLGNTFVPFPVFNQYIEGLATSTYAGSTYHLIDHNCNHFSDEIAQFLCGARVPKHILSQAERDLPAHLRIALTSMLEQLVPDGSQAVYANGVRHSRQDSPDYLTLNNQIEEARIASQELEAKRSTIAEKVARKERKKEKKRKKLREQGGAGDEDGKVQCSQLPDKRRIDSFPFPRNWQDDRDEKIEDTFKHKLQLTYKRETSKSIQTLKDLLCKKDGTFLCRFRGSSIVLHVSVIKLALVVPVTTRSVGFYTQYLFKQVYALYGQEVPECTPCENVPKCTPYAFYRVTLAQFEYRLLMAKRYLNHDTGNDALFYTPHLTLDIRSVIQSISFTFLPVSKIIAGIGTVTYNGQVFYPRCLKDSVLGILYSNLKEIVTAMANPNSPTESRRAFYDLNPLPFAKWNQPHQTGGDQPPLVDLDHPLLLNPDDFMPPGYGVDDFVNDVGCVLDFISFLKRKELRCIGQIPIQDYESPGHQSILVSNYATGLRNPDKKFQNQWADEGMPQGGLDCYWSHDKLSQQDFYMGMTILVGESRPGGHPYRASIMGRYEVSHRSWIALLHRTFI
ncbi:uncharacterized protein LOC110997957 isoform X1 [Pieris rapae]|uniref:uncharacterized protein LOC110997957 isoform X1 n=1 Tax=Pieris rapae TaxID=64459 RepID=UPI001E27A103|nr:uncharacterized protein LOC110997957 isoform X1 [Pieris rapae]XP_022122047.2 uncharacterized protein LOC110997957 isoform X1 [Pieris rapae]XP_045485007.1 uncharacterized protein LOC110997957 isoform X1 [Pieris rapae]